MRKGITITVGNEKGGVGKTTIIRQMSYELARRGHKILCIDMDTQASLSKTMFLTRGMYHESEYSYNKSLMMAVNEGDLSGMIINAMPNIDFIPSSQDFMNFPYVLSDKFGLTDQSKPNYIEIKRKQLDYFKSLVDKIKGDYDFVFIDTPPTASDFTYASAYSSDYVLIAFQTQSDSLDGVVNYIEKTLTFLVEGLNANLEIVGILPNQVYSKGKMDTQAIEDAKAIYGEEYIFKNIIPFQKAINNIPRTGLYFESYWESKIIENFEPIVDEFLEKLSDLER